MANNLNANDNHNEYSKMKEELRKGSGDMIPLCEEVTVMKTEVKEEYYDFEMPLEDMKSVKVKEEYISSPDNNFTKENLGLVTSSEQSLNESIVSGNFLLREDLQKKQKLSKKRLDLKHNKAEMRNSLKRQDGESKKYKCGDCKYATHLKKILKQHIRTHTKDRPFKCTYKNCECIVGQEESCKCGMCGYAFARKGSLKMHILIKHSAEPKKYKCAICNYAAHQRHDLERHIRTHTNDRPFKCTYKNCVCTAGQEESCKCGMCEYAAARDHNLKMHILTKHSVEPKKYQCADCNYATHQKQDLERHIRTHTNDRPYKCTYKNCECTAGQEKSCKCDMCGYAASREHNLKMHILIKHTAEPKKYRCADCKYATHLKEALKQHIHTHSKGRPFKCMYKNGECSAGQEACECNMCRFASAKKCSLKNPILEKYTGKPKRYKCTDCKYETYLKQNLNRHIRTHTNDRPFKCTYKNCDCIAGQEGSCNCDMCEYAAAQKSYLKSHILIMHSGKPKK